MPTLVKNLFDTQAANANGAALRWRGGKGRFWLSGTPDGCTVTLQWSVDNESGGTWFNVNSDGTAFALTAAGNKETPDIPSGYVRAVLSSAGASTSINAGIIPQ